MVGVADQANTVEINAIRSSELVPSHSPRRHLQLVARALLSLVLRLQLPLRPLFSCRQTFDVEIRMELHPEA
jgi:hypothetical protein